MYVRVLFNNVRFSKAKEFRINRAEMQTKRADGEIRIPISIRNRRKALRNFPIPIVLVRIRENAYHSGRPLLVENLSKSTVESGVDGHILGSKSSTRTEAVCFHHFVNSIVNLEINLNQHLLSTLYLVIKI